MGRSSDAWWKMSCSANNVFPVPGSPMMMLMELVGKPPPRMRSAWEHPVCNRPIGAGPPSCAPPPAGASASIIWLLHVVGPSLREKLADGVDESVLGERLGQEGVRPRLAR